MQKRSVCDFKLLSVPLPALGLNCPRERHHVTHYIFAGGSWWQRRVRIKVGLVAGCDVDIELPPSTAGHCEAHPQHICDAIIGHSFPRFELQHDLEQWPRMGHKQPT